MEQRQKANKQKTKKIAGVILASLLTVVLLFSALITYVQPSWLPSWGQIYRFFGLAGTEEQVGDFAFAVQVFDVGKADSILLSCNGHYVLVDAGDIQLTEEVAAKLKKQGITHLDLVVATHPDRDHIGGMAAVLLEFEVDRFMMPRVPAENFEPSSAYDALLMALEDKGILQINPTPGDSFDIGGMQLQVLGPLQQYEGSNNNSIVLKASYGSDSILLMGDAEKEAELDLLAADYDLQADVLKVGHHGSDTSTTAALLDAVQPAMAVISVGSDSNQLPKKQVITRIKQQGAEIYRTDINGTILLGSEGDGFTVHTGR